MPKLARRNFLGLAAGAATLPFAPRLAHAQTWPSKPVRLMVGFPPGGAYDTVARPMAQWLSERLGQPFIVENRSGAGSNLATEAVARAAADGYTLMVVAPTQVLNVTLYERLNFDFFRDIAPVGGVTLTSLVLIVHPSLPVRTAAEFIAYAKANPGKINMASSGNGVINHVAGELLKMTAGIDIVHVPYRGGAPAVTDVIAGQVQMMFATMASCVQQVRTGTVRALAVTTTKRSEALPEVPPLAETVPGFESNDWYGIAATKGTPPDIIAKLNAEINLALANPSTKDRLAVLGGTPMPTTPAEFGTLMQREAEKWASVIKKVGIKAE